MPCSKQKSSSVFIQVGDAFEPGNLSCDKLSKCDADHSKPQESMERCMEMNKSSSENSALSEFMQQTSENVYAEVKTDGKIEDDHCFPTNIVLLIQLT